MLCATNHGLSPARNVTAPITVPKTVRPLIGTAMSYCARSFACKANARPRHTSGQSAFHLIQISHACSGSLVSTAPIMMSRARGVAKTCHGMISAAYSTTQYAINISASSLRVLQQMNKVIACASRHPLLGDPRRQGTIEAS